MRRSVLRDLGLDERGWSSGFRFRRLADTSTPESLHGCAADTCAAGNRRRLARVSRAPPLGISLHDQYGARTKPPRYQRQPVSYAGRVIAAIAILAVVAAIAYGMSDHSRTASTGAPSPTTGQSNPAPGAPQPGRPRPTAKALPADCAEQGYGLSSKGLRTDGLSSSGEGLSPNERHARCCSTTKAAIPWRVALTKDETGENLPAEGAPWRPDGSVQLESDTKFMGVPLNEVLGTIQRNGYFVWVRRRNSHRSLTKRLPAGDGYGRSRHVARQRISEHDKCRCEFGRLSRPLHRHLLSKIDDRIREASME